MKVCILSSVHIALDNRVFYREALSLKRGGYDVTLVAVHDRDEEKDGVVIRGLPKVARWRRPVLWWSVLRLALQEQADVYHFHDPELLLVAPWLRWLTGKPTVYDVHEVYADFIKVKDYLPAAVRYPLAWVFRWLEPFLARLNSGLIFSDDAIAATFRGVRRPKVTLYNFPGRPLVDRGVAATAGIDRRGPIVLHLGGHERNRGTRVMIAAFEQVLQAVPNARLFLVGHFAPPSLEQEVLEDLSERGIGHAVTITGRVPFEEIGEYLRQAAVGWVPWQAVPKNEKNIPTKLFEYMAYQVPVVASDLESTRPFVEDGVNGYRVEPGSPAAHARAILRVLQDPDAAEQMGRAGQERVRARYNWDAMEERLLAFYDALLS
jgi:glycosyltransferase involved in cell wall biosynthesis